MYKTIQYSLIFVTLIVLISTAIGDAFDQTVNQIKTLETTFEQNQASIEEKQASIKEQLNTEFANHALNAPKGEFESDEDYVARRDRLATIVSQRRGELEAQHLSSLRIRRLEIQTEIGRLHRTVFLTNAVTVTLGTYEANKEFFPITFEANNQIFNGTLYINKDDARNLRNNWNQVAKIAHISIDPGYRRALAAVKFDYPSLWKNGVTWRFDVVYDLGNNNSIAFSPDGKYLATGSNDEYGISDIWTVEDGEKFRKMDHGDWVYAVAFSPDGKYFATAGQDETRRYNNGKAIIWEMGNGTKVHTLEHPSYAYAVTFSPNGEFLATARQPRYNEGRANLWNVDSGNWVRSMTYKASNNTIQALTFSPNGVSLATGNVRARYNLLDKVTFWDVINASVARHFEHKNGVYAVAFSPNGAYLATGNDGSVTLWEMSSGRSVRQIELPDTIAYAVTFSPDGKHLAVGKSNSYINFFRVGTEVITLETEIPRVKSIYAGSEVRDLAWHPHGNLISDGKTVYRTLLDPILTDLVASPLHTRRDVNRDGVVDVDDLVLVALNFGKSVAADANPNPDVNRDGVVDREDVLQIIISLEAAGAPAAQAQAASTLTAETLQRWINHAKQLNNSDAAFQRGIRMLEHLLATLTETSTIPERTSLLPNYPNPFNPETWIPYQLVEPADVTVIIYAADGQLVRTITLGHQLAGIYQSKGRAAYWDGRNELGEPVASGVYFYTFTAGDFTATRKMLIRK